MDSVNSSQSWADRVIPLLIVGLGILQSVTAMVVLFQVVQLRNEIYPIVVNFQAHSIPLADPAAEQALPPGVPAPDFFLPDVEGNPVTLSDFSGSRVLLAFANPDCEGCKQFYTELDAFQKQHQHGDEIRVVVISLSSPEINKWTNDFSFLLLITDPDDQVITDYGVMLVPFVYYISEEGTIVDRGSFTTVETLEAIIKQHG